MPLFSVWVAVTCRRPRLLLVWVALLAEALLLLLLLLQACTRTSWRRSSGTAR
jgi:hypothetical protein